MGRRLYLELGDKVRKLFDTDTSDFTPPQMIEYFRKLGAEINGRSLVFSERARNYSAERIAALSELNGLMINYFDRLNRDYSLDDGEIDPWVREVSKKLD